MRADVPVMRQRKGSDEEEALAFASLQRLAFELFDTCETWLRAGIPLVDPACALGKDDALTAPFRVSSRAIYATVAACEATRSWSYKFRDHGLGVHVDYMLFRPIIENLLIAIWILGPDDPTVRIERTLASWESELSDATKFSKNVKKLSGNQNYPGVNEHVTACAQLRANLVQVAAATGVEVDPKDRPAITSIVAAAGEHIPQLGPLGSYWVWSTASGMTHGQSLVGINMSNFDAADRGSGDLDAEVEASPRVALHYVESIQLMFMALEELFHRRLATPHVASTPTQLDLHSPSSDRPME